MRYRAPNEKAIGKLLNFLNALQHKCDGTDFTHYTSSQLHIAFQVSKSTYSVCKKLEIVKETKDGLQWIKENPNREMCLQILSVLLEQSKREKLTPISKDWTALNEVLNDISEKISIGIAQNNNNRPQPLKSPQKEPSLFSDQEQRQKDMVYIAGQIASGVWKSEIKFVDDPEDVATIDHVNSFIMNATKDLLSKLRNQK